MDANAAAMPGCSGSRVVLAALSVAMAMTLLAPAAGAAEGRNVLSSEQADARDPSSGHLVYREQHLLRRDAAGRLLERLVLYRCPDGRPFARKHMDYRGALLAPAFGLEDARTGYREGLRRTPMPQLYVRASRNAGERSAPLRGADVVADAGFDEFVRAHWAALASGHAVPMDFAVPARLRSYRFSLARVGQARIGGEDAMRLRLRLDGWLAWLAPDMNVAYGLQSRRLLRFEGVSNLADPAGGRNWLVRIEFGAPPRPPTDADWAQADAAVLSACAATDTARDNPGAGAMPAAGKLSRMHVLLYQPEIPPNTGNIIRLCANTGAALHLIGPLGFELDDARLRRAGLDYHETATVRRHASIDDCLAAIGQPRLLAFSSQAGTRFDRHAFAPGDALLFGPESRGLPAAVLARVPATMQLRLPMRAGQRSLNLSNAVAVAVFEAWRQQGFDGAADGSVTIGSAEGPLAPVK